MSSIPFNSLCNLFTPDKELALKTIAIYNAINIPLTILFSIIIPIIAFKKKNAKLLLQILILTNFIAYILIILSSNWDGLSWSLGALQCIA